MNIYLRELLIRLLPHKSVHRRKALYDKYLSNSSFIGQDVRLLDDIKIRKRNSLLTGSRCTIEGKNIVDATAGILLGDNSVVVRGISIATTKTDHGRLVYDPVVVGAGHKVARDISPGTILPNEIHVDNVFQSGSEIYFVVGTGRSGSKAIASLLSGHPDSECHHDAFPHLNTWSCDLLYNKRSKREIQDRLISLFASFSWSNKKSFGLSDQKIVPLIPVLAKIFPQAKFVWLLRNPIDFVNSAYARGWFDNSEFGLPNNYSEFLKKNVSPSEFDAAHRCNGHLAGAMDRSDWEGMTAFERICWYWSYWNGLIESEFENLEIGRCFTMKLEDLQEKQQDLIKFLELKEIYLPATVKNKAYYGKPNIKNWNAKMRSIFDYHCSANMKKWRY